MPAINFGILAHVHDLAKRGVHLFRRPLEEPAAAGGEKRVAAKQRVSEQISNMAGRMAGIKRTLPVSSPMRICLLGYAMCQAGNPFHRFYGRRHPSARGQ